MPPDRALGPCFDAPVRHAHSRRGRLHLARVALSLALSTVLPPIAANAQQPGRVVRIGILNQFSPRSAPWYQAFERRLRELGYVEGRNLAIEFTTAPGQADRLPDLAAELVSLKVDLILTAGPEAGLRAASQATSTIPIVMIAIEYDPVALGFVAGLARPGGNITGLSLFSRELTAKRLELLKQAVPKLTRVAVLWHTLAADQFRATEDAARSLDVQLQSVELQGPPFDFERAFSAAVRGRAGAILVLGSPRFFPERARIAEMALKHHLPTSFQRPQYAEAGGLMAYAVDFNDMYRRAAEYADKILKGAKPADLPVEQPTRFELVINLKTAKALGLTMPQSILIRADHVVQ